MNETVFLSWNIHTRLKCFLWVIKNSWRIYGTESYKEFSYGLSKEILSTFSTRKLDNDLLNYKHRYEIGAQISEYKFKLFQNNVMFGKLRLHNSNRVKHECINITTRKACILCRWKKVQNYTGYACATCDVPLCTLNNPSCYAIWHSEKILKDARN